MKSPSIFRVELSDKVTKIIPVLLMSLEDASGVHIRVGIFCLYEKS
jgi:hypothetical protein